MDAPHRSVPALRPIGSMLPQEVRVETVWRQAASELRIFLGTVAAVAGLCWGIVYLIAVQ